jgi:RNA polymerase sigma-70 factor (ECF subfamily)
MSADPSFAEVMARLRADSNSAAALLWQRFGQRLIALARSRLDARLRQKLDPEDVVQSVFKSFFLRYAEGQLDLSDWDSLWALLTVITVRKCGRWQEYFRAGRRRLDAEVSLQPAADDSGGWEALADEPSPSEVAMLTETVEGLLRGLEGRDRDIATLALQGYNAAEISSQLNRPERTVYRVLVLALTKLLALMLVFTADEAWEFIPHKPADDAALPSVHLALLPRPSGQAIGVEQREEWELLMTLRDQALVQLEALKKQAGLNKALDAEIVYEIADDDLRRRLEAYGPDLEDLVGAGHHTFAGRSAGDPGVTVKVIDRRNDFPACARSWKRRPDIGADKQFPDLSLRDAAAVKRLGGR